MPSVGDHLGEFELRREIGRGAMGVVWEAWQPSLERTVALKVLKDAGDDPTWVQRFRSEAGQAAKLSHRGILPIYAFGETDNQTWYAMELVQGIDLSERIQQEKQVPPRIAAAWVRDAARALHHAHEHGVVHRDVKPANIMVQPDGRVVVTDFGLSKGLGSAALTTTGMLLGSPYYMSPEMVTGKAEVGPPADIYALGVTLYELIDGQPPFLADNAAALIRMIADVEPPPLRPRGSLVSNDLVELERIAHKAMAKRTVDRYATAAEMAEDLDALLTGSQALAASQSAPAPNPRRRWLPLGIAGLVVLLGGLAAILAVTASKQRDKLEETDSAMQALEAKVAQLLADDDVEGAQRALDEHAADAPPKADRSMQKLGGQVLLSQLTSGMPGGAKKRQEVKAWPSKSAALTLTVDPPDATLRAINLLASMDDQAVDRSQTTWPAGIWRLILHAPGRMPTIASIVLQPTARGTVDIVMPREGRDGEIHYAGLWAGDHKGADAQLHAIVDPYVLSSRAVSAAAYTAFVDAADAEDRDDLAVPTSRHNRAGKPVRVHASQALAYAEHAGGRVPAQFEFKNAILPAFFAMMHKKSARDFELRAVLRRLLEDEGRRDFSTDEAVFWVQTMGGVSKTEGVPGFDGLKRRTGGRIRAPRLPRGSENLGLILVARALGPRD